MCERSRTDQRGFRFSRLFASAFHERMLNVSLSQVSRVVRNRELNASSIQFLGTPMSDHTESERPRKRTKIVRTRLGFDAEREDDHILLSNVLAFVATSKDISRIRC